MKSKKIIAGVMAVALIFGSAAVLPAIEPNNSTIISANADDLDMFTYGDFDYKVLDDDTVYIGKYNGTETSVTIPSEIDGRKVSWIGNTAFQFCTSLTSVIIPNGVTNIGWGAFYACTNLENVEIPNSVIGIGSDAFSMTKWIDKMEDENSLVIINGILIDGLSATGDIAIPTTVNTIGNGAFSCINYSGAWTDEKITSVIIPDTVTRIETTAFCNLVAINKLLIPKSVTYIADSDYTYEKAIVQCPNIKIYCYANTAGEQYAIDNGFDYELLDEPIDEESSVTTPESSVTDTDSPAPVNSSTTDATDFKHSEVTDGIEITDNTITDDTVKIPESIDGKNVVSVGGWAFAGMEIKSVELPSVLKSIGEYAFFNCPALTSITVPKNVENIGDYALGYYLDENAVSGSSTVTLAGAMNIDTNKIKKIDGFKIYCYSGTAGEKYAVDNGFDYVLLDNSDSDTTTSSKSEATSTSNKTNNSSTANPSTGAAAGLALAALGLGAVVAAKRRK